ncbi:MAG: hypothetical protein BYD32DRAFT_437209 [Podila humilis]|nr:MAG: hypothetical protein BYD32DRAFT_437209 [Podila humilis]
MSSRVKSEKSLPLPGCPPTPVHPWARLNAQRNERKLNFLLRANPVKTLDKAVNRLGSNPHPKVVMKENGEVGVKDATPFSVEVDRTKTVDHLKDLIKAKKAPEFDDIAADKLTLWRVSIPVVPLNKRKPIVLTEVKSAVELDPTDDLSDVFEEKPPKKTIYIIVQRPPQVHTPIPARASTPLWLFFG